MQLKDANIIVTGGASGLGEAVSRLFHSAGAKIVIADLNEARGAQVAGELGERVASVKTDVAKEDDAQRTVQFARENFGALHGLVNCAGIGHGEKIIGKDAPHVFGSFARVLNVNLIGTFNMLRVAAKAMSEGTPNSDGERGVIVNTSSIAAYEGQIGQAAYSASKAGIVGMTLPIARETAKFGIRVMTIAPGLFLTPLMQSLPPEVQESLGKSTPFPQRLGQPKEFASLARQIFENPMLNGATIRLDGAVRLAPK